MRWDVFRVLKCEIWLVLIINYVFVKIVQLRRPRVKIPRYEVTISGCSPQLRLHRIPLSLNWRFRHFSGIKVMNVYVSIANSKDYNNYWDNTELIRLAYLLYLKNGFLLVLSNKSLKSTYQLELLFSNDSTIFVYVFKLITSLLIDCIYNLRLIPILRRRRRTLTPRNNWQSAR